ncbi:MAG: ABC transporter substrate-binding protein [Azospirillaceae bacterium]
MKRFSPVALAGALALSALPAAAQDFTYAYSTDLRTLDPHAFNEGFTLGTLANVYEGLVRRTESLEIVPALAIGWELVEPTRWRFELRQDVRFHDGSTFSAEDVVFSLERAMSETANMGSRLAGVTEVTAVDDLTVEIVTEAPNPILVNEFEFLLIMDRDWALTNGAEVPADLRGGESNFASTNANGTGAYRLTSRAPDVETVAERHADWWGWAEAPGNAERIVFRPIASDATRTAALLSGDIDLAYPVPVQDIERLEAAEDIAVLAGPETRAMMLALDHAGDDNPLADRRVRQAIAQAIDVGAIIEVVMRGRARPLALLATPEIAGADRPEIEPPGYDPEAARDLLAEAGLPEDFTLGLVCPSGRYVNDEAVCQAITAMLERVGMAVALETLPPSQWSQRMVNSDFDALLIGWAPGSLDSLNPLMTLAMSREAGGGAFNWGGYADAELDRLIAAARQETDPAERDRLIGEAWTIVAEDLPFIPLYQQYLAWGIADHIAVPQRPDDVLRWSAVTVAEPG